MEWFVLESVVTLGAAGLVGIVLGWLASSPRSPLNRGSRIESANQVDAAEPTRRDDGSSPQADPDETLFLLRDSRAREGRLAAELNTMRHDAVARYDELVMRTNEREAVRAALHRSQLELGTKSEELASLEDRLHRSRSLLASLGYGPHDNPQNSLEDRHVEHQAS